MRHRVRLIYRKRLSQHTLELGFERPDEFEIQPGQKITFFSPTKSGELARDYTLINAWDSDELAICVRIVPSGQFSPRLAQAPLGTEFEISAAHGYFLFQPSGRPAVFVATGTGIAPFVAFARSGVRDFILVHGVRSREDLYFRELLFNSARAYASCLSAEATARTSDATGFPGQVTGYLENRLPGGLYDFYLCGRMQMVEDVTRIIDGRFPGSLVFAEPFF